MVKPRFSLITLLMIPAAFAVGWWLGARTQKERVDHIERDYARKVQDTEQVAHALNAAMWINQAYYLADTVSPEEQRQKRDHMLVLEILDLARAEKLGKETQASAFFSNASRAIDLLRVSNHAEFLEKVRQVDLVKSSQAMFLDPQNKDYPVTTDFLRRIFSQRESEPSYPARVWIKAVFDGDAVLLRTAYSEALQKSSGPWEGRLKEYQKQLQEDLGGTSPYEFGFPTTTFLDKEGEVEVHWKDQEIRVIKIVREGNAWKLDEF